MQLITVPLIVLALSLGANGANLRSRAQAVSGLQKCPSAQIVSTSTITADGHEITRQTFSCPELGALAQGTALAGETVVRSLFDKRSAAECHTPSPECQCGTDRKLFTAALSRILTSDHNWQSRLLLL